jgi:ribosomal protein L16 Arg81 hydroxylase
MRSTPTLQFVISPFAVEVFFENYWAKRCLHVRREAAEYFDFVLTGKDLDNYFQSKTLHPSFVRAIKSGVDVDAAKWTRVDRRVNTDFYSVVDTEKLFAQLSAGASLVVNVSEGSIPTIGRFCNSLEQELKLRLQANIYVTPPGEKGFVLHYDAHHIFILQTGGRKQWRLFGRAPDSVLAGQQPIADYYKNREPEQELELRAGDLLYLPSYQVHEVYTTDSSSIHISVGVYERRWFHLVQDLAKAAEASFDFQQPLPDSFSSDIDRRKFNEDFAEKLKALLAKNGVEGIAKAEREIFARDQLINADGWLLDLLRVNQLKLDSIVARRPGIDCVITESAKNIDVVFWNNKLSVAQVLRPALDLLLGKEPFSIREIKGLISDSGKLELVTDFVRAGLLTIHSL